MDKGENKGRGAPALRRAQFIIQIYTSDDIYNTFASVQRDHQHY